MTRCMRRGVTSIRATCATSRSACRAIGGRTFSAPVRVSEDQWEIHGCPDDGPAMTVDKRGTVHVIWPTVIGGGTDEPQGALFYASTSDGRTFTPRVRIPTLGSPKPGHPQIVADDRGRLVVAWDEVIDGQRIAVVRELHQPASGRPVTFGDPLRLTTTTTATAAGPATSMTAPGSANTATAAASISTATSDASASPSTYPVLASTSRGLLAVWTSGAIRRIRHRRQTDRSAVADHHRLAIAASAARRTTRVARLDASPQHVPLRRKSHSAAERSSARRVSARRQPRAVAPRLKRHPRRYRSLPCLLARRSPWNITRQAGTLATKR